MYGKLEFIFMGQIVGTRIQSVRENKLNIK
jgi:hypothetical protein